MKLIHKLLRLILRSSEPMNRASNPIPYFLGFADACSKKFSKASGTVFIGHGVETLPALMAIKRSANQTVICDVIEIEDYTERSVKRAWSDEAIDMLNSSAQVGLTRCDKLLTVGHTLGDRLRQYNKNINIIPNYRYYPKVKGGYCLRAMCGLKENHKLILAMNLISSNFENIVDSLLLLPPTYHLITIGSFLPVSYKARVEHFIQTRNLSSRVHFFDRVPYEQLTEMASTADVGVIALSEDIGNHQVAMPNRVFDFIAAEVPFVSLNIKDIRKVIYDHHIGKVIEKNNPEHWASAIEQVVAKRSEFIQNIKVAKQHLAWSNIEPYFLESISSYANIVFLGVDDLRDNQRKLRMADSAIKNGKNVTFCYPLNADGKSYTNSFEVKLLDHQNIPKPHS